MTQCIKQHFLSKKLVTVNKKRVTQHVWKNDHPDLSVHACFSLESKGNYEKEKWRKLFCEYRKNLKNWDTLYYCWTYPKILPALFYHMSQRMTKPAKWTVHPAKTQISLGIHPVWSEPLSFVETWSWKKFYAHTPFSADSRRAVVSYWRKNVHQVLVNCLGGLPRNSVVRITGCARNHLKCVEGP